MYTVHSEVAACSTRPAPTLVDYLKIPTEYHNYGDVFDEIELEVLPEHRSYDLKIDLEESYSPLVGHIYQLPFQK